MNSRFKIAVLATLVTVALLAVYWDVVSSPLPPMEHWGWTRVNLTDEQRRELFQLMEQMRGNRTRPEEVAAAVNAKLKEWGVKPAPPLDIELFYTIKSVVSSINIALLVCLLISYVDIYRKTRSEFTVGLLIFSMTLLLYALSSNPLVQQVFGFQAFGLGPFAMLPDLFTLIALIVLLYQTFK